MAAPNTTQLFNFSEIFENAALSVLEAAGIEAFANYSPDKVPLNRASVSFTAGAADPTPQLVNGKFEYLIYRGCVLEIEVTWDRTENPATADTLREISETAAVIRNAFRYSRWPLNQTNLKWYHVARIVPSGESRGLDQQRMCDVLTIRYSIDFEILRDAWPVET